ncbi:MAG: transposase [Planctomycetota bacterium]
MTRYLRSGHVPIDNNDCERLIKRVALGRKNWLFLGSVGSGHRTATLMTIVSSMVRNDLNVAAYLTDILQRRVASDADYQSMLAPERTKSALVAWCAYDSLKGLVSTSLFSDDIRSYP